jgi:hypothetical protein
MDKNQTPLFSVVATTNIVAVAGKKTRKCLTEPPHTYKDDELDKYLPEDQHEADACAITTIMFAKEVTYPEAAAAIMDLSAEMNAHRLATHLIEDGHIMTLQQVEEMVSATERGEVTGMNVDKEHYIRFFVDGCRDDFLGEVLVGSIHRNKKSDWGTAAYGFGNNGKQSVGMLLLVRNLDVAKLRRLGICA